MSKLYEIQYTKRFTGGYLKDIEVPVKLMTSFPDLYLDNTPRTDLTGNEFIIIDLKVKKLEI